MSHRRPRFRINKAGYAEYRDPRTGEWKSTHRRVAEKKFGRLRPGFHVHHRDENKRNNRPNNLLEAHAKVHARFRHYPDACVRCGRNGHWSSKCYAKTFWDRSPLIR